MKVSGRPVKMSSSVRKNGASERSSWRTRAKVALPRVVAVAGAEETVKVFVFRPELGWITLFEMLAQARNLCVTDGRMVDALRLSTLRSTLG
jgi:hypothetical protein